jgi:hypothetical protein
MSQHKEEAIMKDYEFYRLITLVNKVMAIREKSSFLNDANSNEPIQNLDAKIFHHVALLYVEL